MNILITGTASGIGKETAVKFLNEGHKVSGIDIAMSTIEHENYTHYVKNVLEKDSFQT